MNDSAAPKNSDHENSTINCAIETEYDRWVSKTIRGRIYWRCEYCGITASCLIKHAGASSVCPACSQSVIYPRPEEATRFGGINRRKYAIGLLIIACANLLLINIFGIYLLNWNLGVWGAHIVLLGLLVYLVLVRMTNTGRSAKLAYRWYAFPLLIGNIMLGTVLFLPITGILRFLLISSGWITILSSYLVLFGLLVEQEGYVVSKKLDTLGRIIVTLIATIIIIIITRVTLHFF